MNDKIEELLNDPGGIITAAQITKAGLHRSVLTELVEQGRLYKVSRGIYRKPDTWEDEMYLLQSRFGKGIFSHETALCLHGMTDRMPRCYTMTFPKGYNTPSIKTVQVIVKRVMAKNYGLGITKLPSPCGNQLWAYDVERTLCDIVRGQNVCDIQVVNQAMKRYAMSKSKDIQKLMTYADQLRVKSKILNYMEVLL